MQELNPMLAPMLATLVALALGSSIRADVIDADGNPLTPPGHHGAILDEATGLLWLDATETVGRSLADVQSELGAGGEFEGFDLASRNQIHELFDDAGLPITSPGPGWATDAGVRADVMAFVAIYGQMSVSGSQFGMNLWHANTLDDPLSFGTESALWLDRTDDYWVGDNGTVVDLAGTAQANYGVALVREAPEPSSLVLGATALLAIARMANTRQSLSAAD